MMSPALARIKLPNLIHHCPFELRINPRCRQISLAGEKWLHEGNYLGDQHLVDLHGLKAGLLVSMCYPTVDNGQLRVCCDFMHFLAHLDSMFKHLDTPEAMAAADVVMDTLRNLQRTESCTITSRFAHNIWSRFQLTARQSVRRRFVEAMDLHLQGLRQLASDRADGAIPDLESYISLRRDTSGCKPLFALIEYAQGIDLPEYVLRHPTILTLTQAANDIIAWSTDIYAYNVQQSQGNAHNIVAVAMHERGLDIQSAIDLVGKLCKSSIDGFVANVAQVPSWGRKIDADVATYVRGLQDCVIGTLHWSFETEKYFGTTGSRVKMHLMVPVLPPSYG